MERRRADGGPGLMARVRWGNVGRLAALLAAALLILAGPRGCARREVPSPPGAAVIGAEPQRRQPPTPLPAATPPPAEVPQPVVKPKKRRAKPKRQRAKRKAMRRPPERRAAPRQPAAPTAPVRPPAPPTPQPAPAPTPP